MTNLQQGAQRVPAAVLQRIWLLAPVLAGGAVAAVLGGTVLLPMWMSLDKDRQRLAELEALQSQVALMRRQLSTLDENLDKAQRQRLTLINLIAGSRDPSTFLALLDREAIASDVQLRLFEPQAAAPPPPAGPPGQPAAGQPAQPGQPAQAPPPDPLAVEGLERRQLVMQARGQYPNLINFLRRLEKLDVLVSQSNLNLQVDPLPSEGIKPGNRPNPEVTLKLTLTLFSKTEPAPGAPGAPPPAGAPGAPAGAAAAPGTPATPAAPRP